jgi:hypothetical protein
VGRGAIAHTKPLPDICTMTGHDGRLPSHPSTPPDE